MCDPKLVAQFEIQYNFLFVYFDTISLYPFFILHVTQNNSDSLNNVV